MGLADSNLTPVGIEELLMPEAAQLQRACDQLLELYQSWGYSLVSPPMVDSAQTWRQGELELETIQFPDQLSGQQLGLRSDLTAQIMRIVGQRLRPQFSTRLCYYGEVVRARTHGAHSTRNAIQIGAEHIGDGGALESSWLLLHSLQSLGFDAAELSFGLGHTAIVRQLIELAAPEPRGEYLRALALKDFTACAALSSQLAPGNARLARAYEQLPRLYGGEQVLDTAAELFAGLDPSLDAALAELRAGAQSLAGQAAVHIDCSDLPGYSYHHGLVFSAHSVRVPYALGRGGSYIVEHDGYRCSASGFSLELNKLRRWLPSGSEPGYCLAPSAEVCLHDLKLRALVARLRSEGRAVLHSNNPEEASLSGRCAARVVSGPDGWNVEMVKGKLEQPKT